MTNWMDSGVAKHRERTYLFQLNQTMSVDSTFIGNEARYINHDSSLANCQANGLSTSMLTFRSNAISYFHAVRLVNGEHRIGLFACETNPLRLLRSLLIMSQQNQLRAAPKYSLIMGPNFLYEIKAN